MRCSAFDSDGSCTMLVIFEQASLRVVFKCNVMLRRPWRGVAAAAASRAPLGEVGWACNVFSGSPSGSLCLRTSQHHCMRPCWMPSRWQRCFPAKVM